jgi:hypothetical protein
VNLYYVRLKLHGVGDEKSECAEEFAMGSQPLKRKALCCFGKSGSTVPVTHCHIAAALNP